MIVLLIAEDISPVIIPRRMFLLCPPTCPGPLDGWINVRTERLRRANVAGRFQEEVVAVGIVLGGGTPGISPA